MNAGLDRRREKAAAWILHLEQAGLPVARTRGEGVWSPSGPGNRDRGQKMDIADKKAQIGLPPVPAEGSRGGDCPHATPGRITWAR